MSDTENSSDLERQEEASQTEREMKEKESVTFSDEEMEKLVNILMDFCDGKIAFEIDADRQDFIRIMIIAKLIIMDGNNPILIAELDDMEGANVPPYLPFIRRNIENLPESDRKIMKELLDNIDDEKPQVILPKEGKLISRFVKEISEILKEKKTLFFRIDSKDVVNVGKINLKDNEDKKNEKFTGFEKVESGKFVTFLEKYVQPCNEVYDKISGEFVLKEKSMSAQLANTVLCSDILHQALPKINRIFTVPLPVVFGGVLTFPKRGYDERFCSWMPYDAPEISEPEMNIDRAKEILGAILNEFCFATRQDYVNAIAGLLTPFIRGLFQSFNARTPVFFYIANRERAGKDYLAGITGIVYEGQSLEEAPISTSENNKSNNTEELRKKIMAALIGGRKRLHFANNKGRINNAVFEQIITARKYSDRVLGKSETLTFDNELDFSLSGNTGIGFTPDLANRCRFVKLFLDIEDANSRNFKNPDLHGWVMKNREIILSALYAFVRNWIENGHNAGTKPFASFSEWAEICGGIMEAAGFESPCEPDRETLALGGDSETHDMKKLFEIGYEKYPEQWKTRAEIRDMITEDEEYDIFSYLDFSQRSDQTKFGNKLTKYIGRILSDIRLVVDGSARGARQKLKFTKEEYSSEKKDIIKEYNNNGNLGNLGNLSTTKERNENQIRKEQATGSQGSQGSQKENIFPLTPDGKDGISIKKCEELPKCIFNDCERNTSLKTLLGAPVCLEHLKGQIETVFIESGKKELSLDSLAAIISPHSDRELLKSGFWAECREGMRRLVK